MTIALAMLGYSQSLARVLKELLKVLIEVNKIIKKQGDVSLWGRLELA